MFQQKKSLTVLNGNYIIDKNNLKKSKACVRLNEIKEDKQDNQIQMVLQPISNLEKDIKKFVYENIDKLITCLEELKIRFK